MTHPNTTKIPTLLLTGVLAACGAEETNSNNAQQSARPLQCRSADYIAFDEANYLNQTLRLQAYVDMVSLMKAAESADPFDPNLASMNFTEAERLYQETASLQQKVQGRLDDRFDDQPAVGVDIDAAIVDAFGRGKAASTALEAKLARQTVDKQMIHFFYLSVFHEMVLGKRGKWDEAFGYAGMATDNREESRKALMKVATSRDSINNTTLADNIFNGLIDGACALTEALDAAETEEIDVRTVPNLWSIIQEVDRDMQRVLAFSAGHEAFEMVEFQADLAANPSEEVREKMHVKLAELDPYFEPIERAMKYAGGDSEVRANEIRAEITNALDSSTDDWMQSIDAAGIIERLESEFGIDIKG